MGENMTIDLEIIRAEVLRLPAADRAQLLDTLIESLDTDPDLDAAWDAVADERDAQIEAGTVTPLSLDEVMQELRAKFPE